MLLFVTITAFVASAAASFAATAVPFYEQFPPCTPPDSCPEAGGARRGGSSGRPSAGSQAREGTSAVSSSANVGIRMNN